MVQFAGTGISLSEVRLVFLGIALLAGIVNIVAFQGAEGIVGVVDHRIIGYPVCDSSLKIGQNTTIVSFCLAPSQAEMDAAYTQLTFSSPITVVQGTSDSPALLSAFRQSPLDSASVASTFISFTLFFFGIIGGIIITFKIIFLLNLLAYLLQAAIFAGRLLS